jgi:dihydrofolate reductase
MKLAIIAAIARNRVIGNKGKIPWHFSEDLKRFKRLTTGHPVLMGRKTWESLGKPLSNRRNVVLTSTPIAGVECFGSIDEALEALKHEERVFVIGGAQLYANLLEKVDELYLTFVDQQVEGDTTFPPFEDIIKAKFKEMARENHQEFEFVEYVRVT